MTRNEWQSGVATIFEKQFRTRRLSAIFFTRGGKPRTQHEYNSFRGVLDRSKEDSKATYNGPKLTQTIYTNMHHDVNSGRLIATCPIYKEAHVKTVEKHIFDDGERNMYQSIFIEDELNETQSGHIYLHTMSEGATFIEELEGMDVTDTLYAVCFPEDTEFYEKCEGKSNIAIIPHEVSAGTPIDIHHDKLGGTLRRMSNFDVHSFTPAFPDTVPTAFTLVEELCSPSDSEIEKSTMDIKPQKPPPPNPRAPTHE